VNDLKQHLRNSGKNEVTQWARVTLTVDSFRVSRLKTVDYLIKF